MGTKPIYPKKTEKPGLSAEALRAVEEAARTLRERVEAGADKSEEELKCADPPAHP